MKLTFIGAAHEVTGSCTLIEVGNIRGLVDCGMEQGKDLYENVELPVKASDIDFVLLTHAHIDHSGNLPLLYKNGFRGVVYATSATCMLANIMLRDSANIQMQDAERDTRKAMRAGQGPVEPRYTINDAEGLLKLMRPCSYDELLQINENVTIRFNDAGHLLGSASIEVWLQEGQNERKVLFSGDVGNINQPILRNPVPIDEADFVVIESTYGEFAATDKAEIASLKETKVKAKKTSVGHRRSTPVNPDGSLTIDLHIEAIPGGTNVPKGQQLQFQMDTFRRIIRQNTSRRGMKITFIHGIGDGILKAAIRKELDEVLALRCSYSVGDPAVTIVSIR